MLKLKRLLIWSRCAILFYRNIKILSFAHIYFQSKHKQIVQMAAIIYH